ncbi:MAG: serine hydrolase domain-containing protein [Candidatus Sulfotelmatobacter sp.]|jgi:CubicO group peptidase (beta-lactamase class C family)
MFLNCLSKAFVSVVVSLATVSAEQIQVQPTQPSEDVASIVSRSADKFLKSAPQSVGLSIGVLKDGKAYTYNYGTIEKGKKNPTSANTLYQIASITKTFTGTLLAQAVIEKKVKFDDDVRKYLNGDYPNLEFQGHFIQLGQLVNHNSGLPFNLPDIPENRPPFTAPVSPATREMLNHYTRKDFLADLHKVELKSVPGEKFSYSNTAAVLLSIVLERVYAMPYEEIMKQKIAIPLGMVDTTISLSVSQESRLAKGYDENGANVPGPPDLLLGAGGLKSTVADLLKYAGWELAEEDPAVKLSHEPRFILTNNFSVGLNWQMLRSGSYRRIWQEGNLPGFVSMCMTFPELHMAVVFLANQDDPASSHALSVMAEEIAKSLDAKSAPLLL